MVTKEKITIQGINKYRLSIYTYNKVWDGIEEQLAANYTYNKVWDGIEEQLAAKQAPKEQTALARAPEARTKPGLKGVGSSRKNF